MQQSNSKRSQGGSKNNSPPATSHTLAAIVMALIVFGASFFSVSCSRTSSSERGQEAHILYKYGIASAVGYKDIKQDKSGSREAFYRAAWMGHGQAQAEVARRCVDTKDYSDAYKWYLLATKAVPSDQVFPLDQKELNSARGELANLETEIDDVKKNRARSIALNFRPAVLEKDVETLVIQEAAKWDAYGKEEEALKLKAESERKAKVIEDQKVAMKAKNDAAQERLVLWHLQRATNGSAYNQLEVGLRYLSGKGLPVDATLAAHWLKAAAAQGDAKAKAELAKLGIE